MIKQTQANSLLTESECARILAYNAWEQYNNLFDILNNYLKKPPYNTQLYHEQRITEIEIRLQNLFKQLDTDHIHQADSLYRAAIKLAPADWWLHWKYALFLSRNSKKNLEIINQFREVRKIIPHSDRGIGALGFFLQKMGRWEEAKSLCLEAIRLNPYRFDLFNTLGLIFQKQGNFKKAESHYHKAIEIQPHYIASIHNLARMYEKNTAIDKAIAICQKGLKYSPQSWLLHHDLGIFFKKLGNINQAIKHLRQGLKLNPDSQKTRESLNDILTGN